MKILHMGKETQVNAPVKNLTLGNQNEVSPSSQGDGYEHGSKFKEIARKFLHHPYAIAAGVGALAVGGPVYALTGNIVAAAVAGTGGAVAGVGVKFAYDVIKALMEAFSHLG